MSEKKQNDAPQMSDEQLDHVSGGDGKTFQYTSEMGWDNVKNVKATDIAIEELQIAHERIEIDKD